MHPNQGGKKSTYACSWIPTTPERSSRVGHERTGYIAFLNMAPIVWFSKKQTTIETSVFGTEFVMMKTVMDAMQGLRYKLRMMGIPLSGPTLFYGDNMSVIHNTQRPESQLCKKANAISYHVMPYGKQSQWANCSPDI